MGVTDHVYELLRKGHKAKELLELGFSKNAISRARQKIRTEREAERAKVPQHKPREVPDPQRGSITGNDSITQIQKLTSLESQVAELHDLLRTLEIERATYVTAAQFEARVDGTPLLGLRKRFKCDCGIEGYLAVHIRCTDCGRETWFGWFPDKEA